MVKQYKSVPISKCKLHHLHDAYTMANITSLQLPQLLLIFLLNTTMYKGSTLVWIFVRRFP